MGGGNPKHESRNPKHIRMPKSEGLKLVGADFRFLHPYHRSGAGTSVSESVARQTALIATERDGYNYLWGTTFAMA
jgi:hypothetical protein